MDQFIYILNTVMKVFATVLSVLTAYQVVTGLLFFLPRKRYPKAEPKTRFAALIPARNEENVIGAVIESLRRQDYPAELYDIIVVCNNCTDDTAGAARRAGAQVLTCESEIRCKGDVLHETFERLMGQYDAYCVFDADNIVDPAFLACMNDAAVAGARVAKSRQKALNPYDSWVAGSYDLYFENFHLMFNKPRTVFPLSGKLIGTGFMVTDGLLQEMGGWNTVTMTEDIEFSAMCALRGVRVHYVADALTLDEQPRSFLTSLRQRRRWSGGVQSVFNRYGSKLLRRPTWLRFDVAHHTGMIYVQLLGFIPVLYGLLGLSLKGIAITLGTSLASFWVGMTLTALFLSITARRNPLKMWKTILLYPLFTASWYPLHLYGLFIKPKAWTAIPHGEDKARQKKTPVA